ncbi:thiamine diphosphokinase [Candidatus Berkiella cookevillensis]|uniref:Thiamine diphosphokinase n=1 Tax=Candidatus Berkiella cookevillensis TaxID=437022 RepID=A0A0Q9YGX0_9GAMM|nr:thiamine diphosphokinase [Candidatus Berkiella cookevillensis]MCS5708568.1 thiamine diphosphokinase [Candidatus Berkiella cookevillensis]
MNNFNTIIIADGEIPSPTYWGSYSYKQLICTDGAAVVLKNFEINPTIILGDLDTLLSHFKTEAQIQAEFPRAKLIRKQDQDTTDFEKSLLFAQNKNDYPILFLGIFGKAIDHSLHNLCLFSQFSSEAINRTAITNGTAKIEAAPPPMVWLNEFKGTTQWGFMLPPNCCIHTEIDQTISFFPMPEAELSSTGLYWELSNTKLSQQNKHSVRNKASKNRLYLHTKGLCFVILTQKRCPIVELQLNNTN